MAQSPESQDPSSTPGPPTPLPPSWPQMSASAKVRVVLITVGVLCVVVLFGIVTSKAIDWLLTRGDSPEAQVAPVDSPTLLPTAIPVLLPSLRFLTHR